ncbi:helix-turn-helix transcriptional regulator [uncultured Mitsuokella sp.]|uniref:helix-turn-helix transcriptional regulator n=1 Tax=uncultured Mitsuokella sp. TaxID=453120 RepID=UPI0026744862|nr:helix-turn-helix transcriptional regulator [uncultured Mitsuokella sp.]
MPSYSKFQTILKELRDKRNVTQEELASSLSVKQQTVGKWENGITVPRQPMLIKIADYFHVSVNDLIYGESNLSQPPATPPSTPALTPQEQDLLRKYRVLTDEHKGLLNGQLDAMYNLDKPKVKDTAT